MLASDFNKEGFEMRGTQSFQLLQQLITGADDNFRELSSQKGGMWYYVNWVFGFHRVADARNALRAFMEQAVNAEQSFLLEKQRYTFNRDGSAKETAFHVWQVQTPSNKIEFTDVEKFGNAE
jgi:branched-chain amino acid transport system substrate-binding protein